MRTCCLLFLSAILAPGLAPGLYGQVFQINGGTSTIYQAEGGTITAQGPGFDASVSAGLIAGQFVGGANFTRKIGKATLISGDDYIPFVLPTDTFNSSNYLVAVGAGVKINVANTDIFAFAGATSNDFQSPFLNGVRAENPAGILFIKRQILPHLLFSSNMVFSHQTTAIQSLAWQPKKHLALALSGGVGANQPYGAASMDFSHNWIDVKAAYIEAGKSFHRVVVSAPLMSEPDRGNVMVVVKPTSFLSFSGGRESYLSPAGNSQINVRSAMDQVSGTVRVLGTGISASYYHSSFLGNSNDATAYTVDRSFWGRIRDTSSYLESRPSNAPVTRAFISNVTETLTPRVNVSELISRSQGQTTISFGGALLSNTATISAQYQTYYVPELNSAPFEQALIVDVQIHLPHGISLHGTSFVAPNGSLQYTADAQMTAVRQGRYAPVGASSGAGLERAEIGNMLLRGRVLDTQGQPVAGAALMIDSLLVYTDDDGFYYVRERKPHTHLLKVMVNEFLNGGNYRVVSAPPTISSSYDIHSPDTVIVVQRVSGNGR